MTTTSYWCLPFALPWYMGGWLSLQGMVARPYWLPFVGLALLAVAVVQVFARTASRATVLIVVCSAVVNEGLFRYQAEVARRTGSRAVLAAAWDQRLDAFGSLAVLIGSQGLINVVNSATQQLVVLRLLEMLASGVSAVTGFGFGLAGIASSAAAVLYTRVTKRYGYVPTAAAAAVLVAVAVAIIGLSPWVGVVILGVALSGLFSGVVIPATASMIGLETPAAAQSTAFGLNASSVALGFAIGPLVAGGVAGATNNVSAALIVSAVLAVGLAALIGFGAREPVR